MTVQVHSFYHMPTHTLSYIVFDQPGGHAVIIDPVLDFKAHSGEVWTEFADQQIAFIKEQALKLEWILETHAHADHLSSAQYIKHHCGGKVAIGEGIKGVQQTFETKFGHTQDNARMGAEVFDYLFQDKETFYFGSLHGQVMATPGHTPDSLTYVIEDNAFVGDTLFMPDAGTARCDFPGGDAALLFQSIQSLHALPDKTRIWVCHDYQPEGRELQYMTTVEESKSANIHVNEQIQQSEFVKVRNARDMTLELPNLIFPSVQVNIQAGHLPKRTANGTGYFRIPMQLDADLDAIYQ
jgi:glyoxylase-like metal-dependent hydrolase (beta-lactamase superfamily II)